MWTFSIECKRAATTLRRKSSKGRAENED